jgi:phosphoglycerate dehydrogenase-like enzyme
MADNFRIAVSSDFIKPDGSPAFPMFDMSPLDEKANVEWKYLESREGPVSAEELAGHDALILLAQRFERDSIPADGRLAQVARFGVGYDTVDIAACLENGIAVTITPDGVRRPVAVSIIALMLAITGKMLIKDKLTRLGPDGFAQKINHMGVGLVGKVLGSVGIGNIGAEMFRLAKPFDMEFMAHDPYADAAIAKELGVRMVDMETLMRESDILTVNCPLNDETHQIVNAQRIAAMKPTAFLINTSRGPTVDQKALVKALQADAIAGAGLDVFDPEPPPADDPILKLENVILSPHGLCWTAECFAGIGATAIAAVFATMAGTESRGLVDRDILGNADWQGKLAAYKGRFGA